MRPAALLLPALLGVLLAGCVSQGGHGAGADPAALSLGACVPQAQAIPFGGAHAHKAFALAIGLQLIVDALAGEGFGAVLLVARPEADPVPALRARAGGARLPGDR